MPQARDEAGNIWEIDAQGNPIRLVQPAQQQMPADPGFPYEGPQAEATLNKTRADTAASMARTEAMNRETALKERQFAAQQAKMRLTPAQQKADEGFAQEYVDWRAAGGYAGLETNLKLLEGAIDVLESSDTITGPIYGRLPKPIQQMVNPQGPDVRADVERVIQQSLKALLGGQFAMKEAEQLFARSFDPTQPEQSNIGRVRATLDELRERGRAKESAAQYYDKHGTIAGWTPATSGSRLYEQGGERNIAASGATSQSEPVPPEYQKAYSAFVRSGAFTPEQYAAFRSGLDREFLGEQAGDQTDTYRDEGARILDDIRQGRDLNLSVPGVNSPMSGLDSLRNSAINTPVGAGAANFANMGGFGIPEALSGGAYDTLNEQHPTSAMIGQIGGAIGGAGMVGRAGGAGLNAITRGATRLNQAVNNTRPVFSNLAADATYSGIYGGITGDNPLASAGQGAVGSLLGQGAGKLGGAALRGVNMSAPVQALRNSGVPLTVGQTLGGFARSLEDKATSIPGVGDMIRNRRIEGMEGFNRAAFKEAGSPLDFTPSNIGKEGVQELYDAASTGYDQATAGVNAPLDAQSLADIALARQAGNRLPPNMQASYNKVLENYVDPLEQTGLLSGNTYQQTARALKAHRAKPPGEGFEQEWKEAIGGNMDALRGTMERGGGADAIEGLRRADGLYRNTKTLEDAINSAAGGSQSGAMFVATPSQLQRAGMKTAKKYGGERPFAGLADAGQEVLPSQVPDSGTAGRIAGMLAIGGGLGGGLGYAGSGGDPSAAMQGALLTGLLAAGGTRKAQDLGIASLTRRPDSVRKLGQEIERRRGLFGSGSLPFFIVD